MKPVASIDHSWTWILIDLWTISSICFIDFCVFANAFDDFFIDFRWNLSETTISARFLRIFPNSTISEGFRRKPKPNNDFNTISTIFDWFQHDFGRFRLNFPIWAEIVLKSKSKLSDFDEIDFDFFSISIFPDFDEIDKKIDKNDFYSH